MPYQSVRLQAASEITTRSREAIRNMQKKGDAPWLDAEFEGEGQRRYNGQHLLALVLAEVLMAQGCAVSHAGEFVRAHSLAIKLFLDESAAGSAVTPRFVLAMQIAVEDEWAGVSWQPNLLIGTGTQEEISTTIQSRIARIGEVRETRGGRTKERIVQGPWIAIASIGEAYRTLKVRARAAGYLIDGFDVLPIGKADDGEDDE